MATSQGQSHGRRVCRFSGNVQGVGFRYTARNLALSFDVLGYVRNLPDGRVELVVEGPSQETDRFLEVIKEKMSGFIRRAEVQAEPATGEFSQFAIRH
jgi:acylphosphatase